jgi:hypothetical protein
MCYNFDKNTCDRCGITKKENKKLYQDPFINTYENNMNASFYLGFNGEAWCPKCHKELELEKLFAAMDKREKQGTDLKKLMRSKHENQSKLRNQQ